jgi:hypothetical protein
MDKSPMLSLLLYIAAWISDPVSLAHQGIHRGSRGLARIAAY